MAGKTDPAIVESSMELWAEFVKKNPESFGDKEYLDSVTAAVRNLIELGITSTKAQAAVDLFGYPEDTAVLYDQFLRSQQEEEATVGSAVDTVVEGTKDIEGLKVALANLLATYADPSDPYEIKWR